MRIVISGCSGGGKSTLIDALAARGHATVPEPGRRVVQAALAGQGGALPWQAPAAFAAECLRLAASDWTALDRHPGPVFLDRSGLDAVLWLKGQGLPLPPAARDVLAQSYDRVFLAPPWPELRVTDAERQGTMAEAEAEYRGLLAGYPAHGHPVTLLPKVPVAERIGFLGRELGLAL